MNIKHLPIVLPMKKVKMLMLSSGGVGEGDGKRADENDDYSGWECS
jgi:hypothetical protein